MFVNKHFDLLYLKRDRDVDYNPKSLEKNLDLVPESKLTDRQKCILQ